MFTQAFSASVRAFDSLIACDLTRGSMFCRKAYRSICFVLLMLIVSFSLHYSWKYIARPGTTARGSFYSGMKNKFLNTTPAFSRRSHPQIVAPEFPTWDLFAQHKSMPFVPKESSRDVRALPCIRAPIDTNTSNLNSNVCLLYIVPPLHAPSNTEVTAVIHFTEDRLQLVQLTCSRWGGPVLGILFLYPEELPLLASLVSAAKGIQRSHKNCAMHLELYVAIDIRLNGGSYPINLLRNIGLLAAATPRVVSLDADFIPSVDAATALSQLIELPSGAPTAYVLPVFRFDSHGHILRLPSDKEQLLAMVMLVLATPMLQDHPAQHFTNYAAWPTANSPYTITYGAFYEPYVMLSRGRHNPLFSELFLSSGNDKVSLHFELHAARYQYLVHPHHFFFHIPHASSGRWKNPSNSMDIAWNNLKSFMTHLQSKYQYDFPHDPLAHAGRVMAGSWILSPPVSKWTPQRVGAGVQATSAPPFIKERSNSWIIHPPVNKWMPHPVAAAAEILAPTPPPPPPPPPIIKTAFDHNFFLEADMLNVEIPAALLAENAMKLNKTMPCEMSKECVIVGPVGWSCSSACAALGRICDAARIAFYNNCDMMTQKTICPKGCRLEAGRDLPAVAMSGIDEMQCLTGKTQPICSGRHKVTRRLCACASGGS